MNAVKDVGNGDIGGRAGELVAARLPADAFHDVRGFELDQDLDQIIGDPVLAGDFLDATSPLPPVMTGQGHCSPGGVITLTESFTVGGCCPAGGSAQDASPSPQAHGFQHGAGPGHLVSPETNCSSQAARVPRRTVPRCEPPHRNIRKRAAGPDRRAIQGFGAGRCAGTPPSGAGSGRRNPGDFGSRIRGPVHRAGVRRKPTLRRSAVRRTPEVRWSVSTDSKSPTDRTWRPARGKESAASWSANHSVHLGPVIAVVRFKI